MAEPGSKNIEAQAEDRENIRRTAGGIVLGKKDKILLVQHVAGVWMFPKGGIELEKGEKPIDAAIREIGEEASLSAKDLAHIKDLPLYERPQLDKPEITQIIQMFLFRTEKSKVGPKPEFKDEIKQAKWMNMGEVVELLSAKEDKEFFLKIISELEK